MNILESLIDRIRSTGTLDAFDQDVSDIQRGKMPRQAVKTAGQIMGAYNNPMSGVVFPRIPTYVGAFDEMAKKGPEYLKVLDRARPGWQTEIIPSGKTDSMLGILLNGRAFGKIGDEFNTIRNSYLKGRKS